MKLDLFDTVPFDFDTRTHQIVTIMVMVINRLTNKEIVSFETEMLFSGGYNYNRTWVEDHGGVCYWAKSKALNYLTHPDIPHHEQPEIMKEFREKTKGVPYYFDAVVLSTRDYQK